MKAIAFFVSICFTISLTRHVIAYPETRIDDDIYYSQYQNINKALLNTDSFSWMFNRTYLPKLEDPEYACVYANVTKLGGTGNYIFMQGWTTPTNVTVEVPLFVKTEKTEGTGYVRTEDNAMHVTLKSQNGTLLKDFGLYKLIYSDYQYCDVLRVMSRYPNCELYVHSKHVDKGVPPECMSIYKLACGKQENYHYPVYDPN
uniref:Putative salivary lipocalin n=1 Tax=Ixodes ricinus TaxID=34613 RepID=A0A0K8RKY3_IXORI